MTETIPPRWSLMPLACAMFGLWVIFALFSSRCLYADGSHEFIRTLEAQNFISFMWSRHFAFYIYEWPLVLAIKLGITNLTWLRFAFGLGCFLPWPLALICCRWISPKYFWLAVVGCAAGYLNASIMAVGEHILAHALFWPALFAILFAQPLKPVAAVILLLAAIALLFSYESQMILATLLGILSLWRAWREKKSINDRSWILFSTISALFFASTIIGLCAVLMPEIHSNFVGFKAGTMGIWKHTGWTLNWTIAWATIALVVCISKKFARAIFGKVGTYCLFVIIMIWGVWPLLAPERLDNAIQYDNRSLDLLVPLMLLPVALILRFRPEWIDAREMQLKQLAAVLLIAQSLWQISATVNWYRDVIWMQEILASKHGVVPLRATVLAVDGMQGRELHKDGIGGRFDWTWPCLSIAFAPKPQINCIICSEVFLDPTIRRHYWQPFDPLKPETLPDLRHYQIDFSSYIAELNKQLQPSPAP